MRQYHFIDSRDLDKLKERFENKTFSQQDLDEALLKTCQEGGKKSLEYLIELGANINASYEESMQPIFIAAEHANFDALEVLLEKGVDPNSQDHYGWSPLHLLIDSECDGANQTGEEEPELEGINILLKHGSKVTLKDKKGKTPLDIAEHYNHINMIKLLKENQN